MRTRFEKRLQLLETTHKELIQRSNKKLESDNGIYNRYTYPALTPHHTPIFWRYDLNYETNPYLMERYSISALTNAGAVKLNGRYFIIACIAGVDRKSFLAVAESPDGIDNFEFWDYPVMIPEIVEPDVNVCDMRLVLHEDGWLYGIFTTEKRNPEFQNDGKLATITPCCIVRTTDLKTWERLPDLKTSRSQQCGIVLHPELVNGKYAFYTGSKEGIVEAGNASGIGLGLTDSITNATIQEELITDQALYNTIGKLGPAPLKTQYGWLHLAHEIRNTASGLHSALYLFMTDLKNLTSVIYKPGGYLVTDGDEKAGGIANAVYCNGWIAAEDGTIYIYYTSSDKSVHIATTTLDQLLDYVMNTSADMSSDAKSIGALYRVIDNNKALMQLKQSPKEKTAR